MYPTRYVNPEAVGYLVAEYVRCGKPNCRCERGQKHGPYWYLYFRRLEDGVWRQRKRYVSANRVQAVRQWLEANKARDRATRALMSKSRRLRAAVQRHRRGEITYEQLQEACQAIEQEHTG